MTVGERIRKARKKEQLSQDKLAEKIGVKRAVISKYESERITNIPIDRIRSLAKVLNVPMAYLLGDVTNPEDWSIIHIFESPSNGNKENSKKLQKNAAQPTVERMLKLTDNASEAITQNTKGLISSAVDLGEVALENIKRINNAYEKLNETGKKVAVDRVEELADIPKYTEKK